MGVELTGRTCALESESSAARRIDTDLAVGAIARNGRNNPLPPLPKMLKGNLDCSLSARAIFHYFVRSLNEFSRGVHGFIGRTHGLVVLN